MEEEGKGQVERKHDGEESLGQGQRNAGQQIRMAGQADQSERQKNVEKGWKRVSE